MGGSDPGNCQNALWSGVNFMFNISHQIQIFGLLSESLDIRNRWLAFETFSLSIVAGTGS